MAGKSIAAMVAALEAEIEVVRKDARQRELLLVNGAFAGRAGDLYLYTFQLDEDRHFNDDSPVQVVVEQGTIEGVIVSWQDHRLTIALKSDLGLTIATAQLITDDTFLLERLRDALKETQTGGAVGFNALKADQAIGDEPANADGRPMRVPSPAGVQGLNDSQREAFVRAVAREMTYIWGPPGTGKTTVLARIVEELYRQGLRVLVVSNTNVAVDTLTEKIADRLEDDPGYLAGRVLRLGNAGRDLARKHGDNVLLDRVCERLAAPLIERRDMLAKQHRDVQAEREQASQGITLHEGLVRRQAETGTAQRELQECQSRQKLLRTGISDTTTLIQDMEEQIARAEAMSFIGRLLHKLDPNRLRNDVSRLVAQRGQAALRLDQLLTQEPALAARLREAHQNVLVLADEVSVLPPLEQCREDVQRTSRAIAAIKTELEGLEAQIVGLRARLVDECRILASTVYQTYLRPEIKGLFDCVVLDEASMLMLPLAYYAAGRAKHKVVVTGDFRQLPPIVKAKGEATDRWLKADIFAKSGVQAQVEQGNRPHSLVALTAQYRMRRELCELVNQLFYPDNPLVTDASVVESDAADWLEGGPLHYVDTSAWRPWAAFEANSRSCYNVSHGIAVSRLVGRARRSRLTSEVAPMVQFVAQRKLIDALLRSGTDGTDDLSASTIFTFQGKERDVAIVEITQAAGVKPWGWVTDSQPGSDGARLFNVAFSRARKNLVVVADFSYVRNRLSPRSVLRRALEYIQQHGTPIPTDVIGLAPGAEEVLEAEATTRPGFALNDEQAVPFTADSFYPAFRTDLRGASESIVIFSPFMTEDGTARWADLLTAKAQTGVAVRLVLRPPHDDLFSRQAGPALAAMRDAGVAVDFRGGMHEKLAFIDGEIVWHGSLNILSHSSTTEAMLRIPGGEPTTQLAQMVSTWPVAQRIRAGGYLSFARQENPPCRACGAYTMMLRHKKHGPFFKCAECGATISLRDAARWHRSNRGPSDNDEDKDQQDGDPQGDGDEGGS